MGKTYIAANLVRITGLIGTGLQPLKPVMSGYDPGNPETSDAGILLKAANRPVNEKELDDISPWRYRAPLAPDLAARLEGKEIDYPALRNFCVAAFGDEPLLVEGAGGIMSPIAEAHTCLDLASDLNLPLLLVTGSYLGAMSHCLTAVIAARSRKCDITAIIVNQSIGTDLTSFCAHLRAFMPDYPIFPISRPGEEIEFLNLVRFLDF